MCAEIEWENETKCRSFRAILSKNIILFSILWFLFDQKERNPFIIFNVCVCVLPRQIFIRTVFSPWRIHRVYFIEKMNNRLWWSHRKAESLLSNFITSEITLQNIANRMYMLCDVDLKHYRKLSSSFFTKTEEILTADDSRPLYQSNYATKYKIFHQSFISSEFKLFFLCLSPLSSLI